MIRPPPRVPRVQRPAVSRFYKKPANGARVSLHQTSAGYGLLLSRLGCDPSFQLPSDTRSSALFGLLISCVLIKPLKGFTRVGRDQETRPALALSPPGSPLTPTIPPPFPPTPTSAVSLSPVFFNSQSCSSHRAPPNHWAPSQPSLRLPPCSLRPPQDPPSLLVVPSLFPAPSSIPVDHQRQPTPREWNVEGLVTEADLSVGHLKTLNKSSPAAKM